MYDVGEESDLFAYRILSGAVDVRSPDGSYQKIHQSDGIFGWLGCLFGGSRGCRALTLSDVVVEVIDRKALREIIHQGGREAEEVWSQIVDHAWNRFTAMR